MIDLYLESGSLMQSFPGCIEHVIDPRQYLFELNHILEWGEF